MTDNVSDAQFEAALTEAKVEGNLSRANTTNAPAPKSRVSGHRRVGSVVVVEVGEGEPGPHPGDERVRGGLLGQVVECVE